jgi:hypothetical protein
MNKSEAIRYGCLVMTLLHAAARLVSLALEVLPPFGIVADGPYKRRHLGVVMQLMSIESKLYDAMDAVRTGVPHD